MSKKAKARFIFFLISSVALALVISLIIGICFFVSLFIHDKVEQIESYKQYLGYVDAKKTTKTVYSSNIIRNGVMCVNFSDIAEFSAFTVVGNGDEMMFYFNNDDGDLLVVNIGSNIAYANGNPINMPTSVYTLGDDIYIPVDFLSKYIDGVTFRADDEKRTIHIEFSDTAECALRLKYPSELEPIDPETWVDPRLQSDN